MDTYIDSKPSDDQEFYREVSELSRLDQLFAAVVLRTFAPIATAHRYCARKFTRHVMHRAHALRNKINNDREDGHCYSFAWI